MKKVEKVSGYWLKGLLRRSLKPQVWQRKSKPLNGCFCKNDLLRYEKVAPSYLVRKLLANKGMSFYPSRNH